MGSEQKNARLGLMGLALGGVLIFSVLYYANVWATRPETYSSDPGRAKIVLALNESVQIGSERIIYKGLAEGGRFTMAVVLLAMDPEYPYIHNIVIRDAKDGFSLVGHRFELISAGSSRVRFWHLKETPMLALNVDGRLPVAQKPWLGPKNAWGP
jgi:hypothetical protein